MWSRSKSPLDLTPCPSCTTPPASRPRLPIRPDRFVRTSYDLAGRACVHSGGTGGQLYANPVTTTSWDLAGRAVAPTSDCSATPTGTCGTLLRTVVQRLRRGRAAYPEHFRRGPAPTSYGYDAAGQLTGNHATRRPRKPGHPAHHRRHSAMTRLATRPACSTVTATPSPTPTRRGVCPSRPSNQSTAAHPAAADRTWTTVYDAARPADTGATARSSHPYPNVRRTRTAHRQNSARASTTARSLGYDPLGRVTSATSPAGNHTYTWTDRGLLATARRSRRHRPATPMTPRRISPSGSTPPARPTFGYDPAGRLTTVANPLTGGTPHQYPTTPQAGWPPSVRAPATPAALSPTTT